MRCHWPRAVEWSSLTLAALLVAACESGGQEGSVPGPDSATPPLETDAGIDAASDETGSLQDDATVSSGGADARADAGADASLADAASDAALADAGPLMACSVEPPTACPEPAPRYGDIAPIIEARCQQCHSPLWTGPWPLDTYGHVADWQDTIRSSLIDCSMPPPEARVPMTDEERLAILTWIRCGLPR